VRHDKTATFAYSNKKIEQKIWKSQNKSIGKPTKAHVKSAY